MKPLLAPLLLLLAAPLSAQQFVTIASETFDYPVGSLANQAGGTGWANSWYVENNTILDAAVVSTPGFDPVGEKATTQYEHGGSYRLIDAAAHPSILDNGVFGLDGTSVWISFDCVREWWSSDWYGGIGLFHQFNGSEKLFLGSPWGTDEWGFDAPYQALPWSSLGGSNCAVQARLVYRIDFQAGDERVRLWVDPASPHPSTLADVDNVVPDFRFNEIRMQSGSGGQAGFSFDDIRVEYSSGSPPLLALAGACPGPTSVAASGLTPSGLCYLAYGVSQSGYTIPSGGCVGSVVALGAPALLAVLTADPAGNASYSGTVPAAACGAVYLQGFDLGSCQATNVLAL